MQKEGSSSTEFRRNLLRAYEERNKMKIYYDNEVDALYIELGHEKPEGVLEISEGVNIDLTQNNRIVGIEILSASRKLDIKTIMSYSIEFNKGTLQI